MQSESFKTNNQYQFVTLGTIYSTLVHPGRCRNVYELHEVHYALILLAFLLENTVDFPVFLSSRHCGKETLGLMWRKNIPSRAEHCNQLKMSKIVR